MQSKHLEVVKQIENFPNYYISNYGNIFSVTINTLKKLQPRPSAQKGYLAVVLYKNGIKHQKYIHHLVAHAFRGYKPSNRKIVIDHKDENHLNNYIENIQIITQRQNISKSKKHQTKLPTGVYNSGKKYKSYITIDGYRQYLGTFQNQFQAKRAYDEALALIPLENNKFPINYKDCTLVLNWNPHFKKYNQTDLFNTLSILHKAKNKLIQFIKSFNKTA
jgi:hypothetical protein